MKILKKFMFAGVLITFSHFVALDVGAEEQIDQKLPSFVNNWLRSRDYYEDFMAEAMQSFRQYAGQQKFITKESIEEYESINKAEQRATNVQKILIADLNADGKVTKHELEQYGLFKGQAYSQIYRTSSVIDADTSKDGVISYDEMRTYNAQTGRDRFGVQNNQIRDIFFLDTNKDGRITAQEFKKRMEAAFYLYDTDKDDYLSSDEKAALPSQNESEAATDIVEKLKLDNSEELHVVGIYEGLTRSSSKVHGPIAQITLDRPGKKVALLLTSYHAVKWKVDVEKGTQVGHIYFSSGTAPNSEVWIGEKKYSAAKSIKSPVYVYEKEGEGFKKLLGYIQSATGREKVASFHGDYQAPLEGFAIKALDQLKESKKKPYVDLPISQSPSGVTFYATIGNRYGIYQPDGKLLQELPQKLEGATYVTSTKEYYRIGDSGLIRMNAKGEVLEEIPIDLEVPPFSSPKGIAYNEKTKKIAITSLGGEGFLYHYDPFTKKWTFVSQNNRDYDELNYDPVTGNYVSSLLYFNVSRYEFEIRQIGLDGKSLKQEKLAADKISDFISSENSRFPPIKIVPSGQYWVIILTGGDSISMALRNAHRIYLYDRKTGNILLTYASKLSLTH